MDYTDSIFIWATQACRSSFDKLLCGCQAMNTEVFRCSENSYPFQPKRDSLLSVARHNAVSLTGMRPSLRFPDIHHTSLRTDYTPRSRRAQDGGICNCGFRIADYRRKEFFNPRSAIYNPQSNAPSPCPSPTRGEGIHKRRREEIPTLCRAAASGPGWRWCTCRPRRSPRR